MVLQGSFRTFFIALTAFMAIRFSSCKNRTTDTAAGVFLSFKNIGITLCQVKCTEYGLCLSIEYHIETLTCRLSSMYLKNAEEGYIVRPKLDSDVPEGPCSSKSCKQGMRCLVTGSEKAACVEEPGGIRQPCVDDNDCYINGSLCYKGRCMCTTGLSYHKAGQACVRRCRVYGKIMSVYEELSITGHNDFESRFTPNAKCIHMCTAEKSFLCLSVDMTSTGSFCHLSSSGYLDVSKSDRQSGDVGWLFGTRDCEYP